MQWRLYLLILAIALGGASYILGSKLQFETSIEGMFAAGNQQLEDYHRLKQIFGGTELVLAVYNDPKLFTPQGIKRLEERGREINQVHGVEGILSLAEINTALRDIYSWIKVENPTPILDHEDKLAQQFLEIFQGYTHGADQQTAAIVCLLESLETLKTPREKTIVDLRHIVRDWPQGQVTGEPVLVADGFRFIQRDGQRLNRICLLLMSTVIIVCFRSLRWVFIPICVMQFAVWLTFAILVLLDWQLTMVSSMLSAIVAVISVATVVHITMRFRESRLQHGRSRIKSVEFAFASLIVPITWTCVTTAAGFLALTLAEVEPISDFGWMMAIGSMVVLVSILLIVPGLALLGKFDADPHRTWVDGKLTNLLTASSSVVSRHPKNIAIAIFSVFAVLAIGISFLQVETEFIKNFRRSTEIVRAYKFVENKLGGAGMIDVVIVAPSKLNKDFLTKVHECQDELREIKLGDATAPALTHVISFADADRAIRSNPLMNIPNLEQFRFTAMAEFMPGFAAQMKTTEPADDGHHYFRIMLRTSQQKSADQQAELIDYVERTVAKHFPDQPNQGKSMTSGFFVLLSNLINSVLQDQTRTFVAATLFIAIAIFFAFGSVKLVLIGLLPNILPIVGLLGTLGWLGININLGTAMIAAVSIGLSIDGTIHYLNAYRQNRKSGFSTFGSIRRVQKRIGRAVIYATIALVVGFGSLCTSEFIPTVFFGSLVGLSMLGGLFGNLVLLPVLLTIFDQHPGDADQRKKKDPLVSDAPIKQPKYVVLTKKSAMAVKPADVKGSNRQHD